MAAITAIAVGTAAAGVAGAAISAKASGKAANAQVEAADAATQVQHQQYLQTRQDLAPARQTGNYAFQQMANLLGLPGYDPNDNTFDQSAQEKPQWTSPNGAYSFNANGLEPNFGSGIGGNTVFGSRVDGIPDVEGTERQGVGRLDTSGDRYRGFTESPGYQFSMDQAMRGASAAASAGGFLGSGRAAKASMQYAQGLASQEYNNYWNQLASVAGTGQAATSQTAGASFSFGQQAGNNAVRAGDARASGLVATGNAWNNGLQSVAGAAGMAYGAYGGGT